MHERGGNAAVVVLIDRERAELCEILYEDGRGGADVVAHVDELRARRDVRAMVVDKDRQPKWSPATIAEIDPAVIMGMFP